MWAQDQKKSGWRSLKRCYNKAWLVAAALGIGMMIFGVCQGELPAILQKATNICLECIGIG